MNVDDDLIPLQVRYIIVENSSEEDNDIVPCLPVLEFERFNTIQKKTQARNYLFDNFDYQNDESDLSFSDNDDCLNVLINEE